LSDEKSHLFCFGLGYSAGVFARHCLVQGWRISGTRKNLEATPQSSDSAIILYAFGRNTPLRNLKALDSVTHILVSIPPDGQGCPVADELGNIIAKLPNLKWLGYLSTTGVYGNTDGKIVNETSPVNPSSSRSQFRVNAENSWLKLYHEQGVPIEIFRLAGIYGPGRSQLDRVRAGNLTRINKPGHLFSRIHVDDISAVLRASVARSKSGAIYNVCDDVPALPADVTAYACKLLEMEIPPLVSFSDAKKSMSAMGLSFWNDNRCVDNSRIKNNLGVGLAYPDYRQGLSAIHKIEIL
jgi:hypothetical protein